MSTSSTCTSNNAGDGPPTPKTTGSKRLSALTRATLAFIFIFATIAAGHLLMVALNAADRSISTDVYNQPGVEARWFGDEPLLTAFEQLQAEVGDPAQKETASQAADALRSGQSVAVHMLPVSPFLVQVVFGLVILGLLLLAASRWIDNNGLQSVVGVFAGLLIWTGAVEYGLLIAGRLLGIAKSVELHGQHVVGAGGEYVLLKHTWGLLILVSSYLLFLESNRCRLFMWFRKQLPLMRGPLVIGRIDNFAPRTSFQYVTIMWAFYVLLLWAYDESVFGVHGLLTHALFFGSFATGGYLLLRLYRQATVGAAIRYAIPAAMLCWVPIEIAAKWGIFTEPWLILNPLTAVAFFGGAAIGTWLIVREIRRPARESAAANGV